MLALAARSDSPASRRSALASIGRCEHAKRRRRRAVPSLFRDACLHGGGAACLLGRDGRLPQGERIVSPGGSAWASSTVPFRLGSATAKQAAHELVGGLLRGDQSAAVVLVVDLDGD